MYDNAVVIHAMLRAVGVNAHVEVLDYASQLSNFFKGDFQLSAFGYSGRAHGALRYANFIGPRASNPRYQWDSPDIYPLVMAALAATDEEALAAALADLHRAMADDLPLIGLYNDYGVALTSDRVTGFRTWTMGRPRLWGVALRHGGGAQDGEATPP
ncbi:MAG: hypothetical protein MI723_16060, partial [Caulobacterales bacterium]|nr:hypothetical protein [Caulobacterales bacterium]